MNKIVIIFVVIASVYAGNSIDEFLAPIGTGQKCDNPIDAYTVTSFDVSPYPPQRGVEIVTTSVGTFTQAETITGIHVIIFLDGRSFYQETIAESGSYSVGQSATFTYSQKLPSIAPRGSYKITGGLINSSGTQISCWQVTFNLS